MKQQLMSDNDNVGLGIFKNGNLTINGCEVDHNIIIQVYQVLSSYSDGLRSRDENIILYNQLTPTVSITSGTYLYEYVIKFLQLPHDKQVLKGMNNTYLFRSKLLKLLRLRKVLKTSNVINIAVVNFLIKHNLLNNYYNGIMDMLMSNYNKHLYISYKTVRYEVFNDDPKECYVRKISNYNTYKEKVRNTAKMNAFDPDFTNVLDTQLTRLFKRKIAMAKVKNGK